MPGTLGSIDNTYHDVEESQASAHKNLQRSLQVVAQYQVPRPYKKPWSGEMYLPRPPHPNPEPRHSLREIQQLLPRNGKGDVDNGGGDQT